MTPDIQAPADNRSLTDLQREVLARHAGYVPDWQPADGTAGNGLTWIFARFRQAVIQRLNQAPDKNRLAFFDLLGIGLAPAQEARAPILFQLTQGASDTHAPAGTQVAAPPPPGSSNQIVYETEQDLGVAAANLVQAVSLWSGIDEYIDHTAALSAGQPVTLFDHLKMQPTPHQIYIAHNTLLALTASVEVDVTFELTQVSSNPLEMSWEYWDGQVWRGFKNMNPPCFGVTQPKLDGTAGFTGSGTFILTTDCATAAQTSVNGITAFWIRGELVQPLPPDPAITLPQATEVRLTSVIQNPVSTDPTGKPIGGVLPDNAFGNGSKLDLTTAFYPLGQQPQPGVAFYISSNEAFSKPKAQVTLAFFRQATPLDSVSANSPTALTPAVVWEYWNGTDWTALSVTSTGKTDFTDSPSTTVAIEISFAVPVDMALTKVNGTDGLWVRARLVSGGYGFSATITVTGTTTTFTYVVTQPPALSDFRIGYVWDNGPYFAEHVLTYNDFQYQDVTAQAQLPGTGFPIFKSVADVSPALYLGFDHQLPVDDLGFYFDFVEDPADEVGPALVWEYWNGGGWIEFAAQDETNNLRLPGVVSFIGEDDSQQLARFDAPHFWIRARLKEDGPPGEPVLNALYPNTVWASQRRTVTNAALGAGAGIENQVLVFTEIPVLEGERIEVQEVSGASANVEWRILTAEVTNNDPDAVPTLEAQLAQEGAQTDFVYGDIHLVRDRTKAVTQVWVRWQAQPNFYASGPLSRDYVPDRAFGRVMFGDGVNGRVLPAGAAVQAALFQTGGGAAGNVPSKTITQMLGSIAGIQGVTNVRAAEGGSDGETLAQFNTRAASTLRTRGRALTASDYEVMAREASSAVGAAYALAVHDSNGRPRPGWVTLHIIPRSLEDQPVPSFGLRDEVRAYIAARAPAAVAGLNQVNVTAPVYQPVDVRVTLAPLDPSQAAEVEQAARAALNTFLHPLFGGPNGQGWPPGRGVFLSDVAAALSGLAGLDYVEDLELYKNGALQQEQVTVGPDQIVAAGQIRINVQVAV